MHKSSIMAENGDGNLGFNMHTNDKHVSDKDASKESEE